MLRAIYTAGTGMMTQEKRMDVLTNNLANIETAGFKRDTLVSRSFDELFIQRMDDTRLSQMFPQVGPLNLGIHADLVYTEFEQGSLEQTDVGTDIALAGEGFFVVNTPQGERYTRDSAYKVDATGFLTTTDGNALLGQNGPINVGAGQFSVNAAGDVSVNGQFIDRIRHVNIENTDALRKQGYNLYFTEGDAQEAPGTAVVKQGFREVSNVDMSKEMVKMMEIYRNYETNQKVIRMLDETLSKTVNEIGKV